MSKPDKPDYTCKRCGDGIIRGDQYVCPNCRETFCYTCLMAHDHPPGKEKKK